MLIFIYVYDSVCLRLIIEIWMMFLKYVFLFFGIKDYCIVYIC